MSTHSMITRAKTFAEAAHESINQRRRYTDEPYIVHPASVAKLVSEITDDESMLSAAWLHDVVEDTPLTLQAIHDEFGADVAQLVSELTGPSKPEDGNRRQRKAIDLAHLERASSRAKTIKLADIIDNLGTIAALDPQFAKIYMMEKRQQLGVLEDGHPTLFNAAKSLIQQFFSQQQSG